MKPWMFLAFESEMGVRYLDDWVGALGEESENELVATLEGLQVLPRHFWKRPQFDLLSGRHYRGIGEVIFKGDTHQRLFNILLVDFLSKPQKGTFDLPEADGPARTDHTYLFYLRRICDEPKLNPESDILRVPVKAFVDCGGPRLGSAAF